MPTQLAPHAEHPPKGGPFRLVSDYRPAGDRLRAVPAATMVGSV